MRGTAGFGGDLWLRLRITPAHAGNSGLRRRVGLAGKDHPRSCGEQRSTFKTKSCSLGSPPLMRGTVKDLECMSSKKRITPAHAGNSLYDCMACIHYRDHPRSCGEQPSLPRYCVNFLGSPPLMRGTVSGPVSPASSTGITPAHAGNSPLYRNYRRTA